MLRYAENLGEVSLEEGLEQARAELAQETRVTLAIAQLADLSSLRQKLEAPLRKTLVSHAYGGAYKPEPAALLAAAVTARQVLSRLSGEQLVALSRTDLTAIPLPESERFDYLALFEEYGDERMPEEVIEAAVQALESEPTQDYETELQIRLEALGEDFTLLQLLETSRVRLLSVALAVSCRRLWLDLGKQGIAAQLASTAAQEVAETDRQLAALRDRELDLPPPPLESFLDSVMPAHAPPHCRPITHSSSASAEVLL
jgi:hypothetical protein